MVRHSAAAAGMALRWRALFAALLSTAALVQSVNIGGRWPECIIQIVGSKGIVAATSLQERRSDASSSQQSTGPPSVAKIDCVPGTETAQVTLTGGLGFAGFADNFTGVDFVQDDTLPGAILKLEGQNLVIRDSTFSNLAHGAPATLIVINSTLSITNTTFASNTQAAAGAIFMNGSSVTVYNSLFDRNKGFQSGAINAIGGSNLLVNLTVFRSNDGSQGGGIGMQGGGKLRVIESLFLRNTAQNGAGIFVQKSADAFVSNCTFSSNTAAVNGAGVFQELTKGTLDACILRANKAQTGGGGYYNRCTDVSFVRNQFENNTANAGGAGLELNQCVGDVQLCIFSRNRGEKGGGLFMDQCATNVANTTFDSNSATLLGGGLYRSFPSDRSVVKGCKFAKNKANQYGGAIYEQNVADGAVQGCRFSANTAPTGAAIYSRMSSTDIATNSNLDSADVEYADH
ncbi:probable metabotropic glutamate receptor-like protein P [Coccomyxa sp. Obi]|nr:probable metabotropic glutamate receptor-like protein P [Coccomyxa sp. Obi]